MFECPKCGLEVRTTNPFPSLRWTGALSSYLVSCVPSHLGSGPCAEGGFNELQLVFLSFTWLWWPFCPNQAYCEVKFFFSFTWGYFSFYFWSLKKSVSRIYYLSFDLFSDIFSLTTTIWEWFEYFPFPFVSPTFHCPFIFSKIQRGTKCDLDGNDPFLGHRWRKIWRWGFFWSVLVCLGALRRAKGGPLAHAMTPDIWSRWGLET